MSLLKLFKRFRWSDWLFLLVIIGLTVLQVWCTMSMTDAIADATKGISASNVDQVRDNCLILMGFAALGTLCQAANAVLASAITANFATELRRDLYKKVESFSLAEINSFSTASLITRTSNDIEQVQMAILLTMRMFFSAPITAIWAILKIQASSAELTGVTAIGIAVIVVVLVVVMVIVFPKFKIAQQKIDRLNLITRESVSGIRVVRAYNAERYQQAKFQDANDDLTKLNLFTSRMISLFNPVMTIVLDGVSVGIYFVGALLIDGLANPLEKPGMYATVVAFSSLAIQVIMAFMMLLFMFILLPRASVAAKRIDEVISSSSSIKDPEDAITPNEVGTIEFNDVSFTYPDSENPVISHISFSASKGDTIAIIGATGCGKTTLINLISRLYDANEGEVKIDGVNVKDIKQTFLRSKIGFVPQKGLLFSGSVATNICFGLENVDEARMKKAADVACASEFVEQMAEGYDSHIAQGGSNVSGGQRQRLCIARACAIEPEIFVFDDSFSALDFKTDKAVRHNLKEAYPDATKVIVAQRVGTIMDASLILVLENGKLVGKGTHKELLSDCKTYRDIALSQLSKEELGL